MSWKEIQNAWLNYFTEEHFPNTKTQKYEIEELTPEENRILLALSRPPLCMHDPAQSIDLEHSWQCGKCGLIAPKIMQVY